VLFTMIERIATVLVLGLAQEAVAAKASRCASFDTCFSCATGGCGWCSFVLGQGTCMGLGDGEFTCNQVYNTIPDSTCWDHSTAGGASGPSGGYNCNSGQCVAAYEGPTPPDYNSLSDCLNGVNQYNSTCRPADSKPPFWRCNVTTKQCETSQTEGTTKDQCDDQCHDNRVCSGGKCASQGVNGAGSKLCAGTTCPQPEAGPNCSSVSGSGCSACIATSNRCGWCPYYKTCFDIAPHAPIFMCPPGFTLDKSSCPKVSAGAASNLETVV